MAGYPQFGMGGLVRVNVVVWDEGGLNPTSTVDAVDVGFKLHSALNDHVQSQRRIARLEK